MSSSTNLGQLDPREWDALQDLADRFAAACHEVPAPEMVGFLPPLDHRLRLFALRELIAIEIDTCWRRAERRCVDQYLCQFPELQSQPHLVVELLHEELRARQAHKDRPTLTDYATRHPNHVAELQRLLCERPIPGLIWHADATSLTGVAEQSGVGTTATFRVDPSRIDIPAAGERIDDFEVLRILGEGSFGTVFLARQVSLGRQVALKIASDTSGEARTLASLEHDHIVQVFSETVHRARNLRLLCMQYVAGPTLERIIVELHRPARVRWSGRDILDAIDRLSQQGAVFHPAALRDRELLAHADFVQAVCWLGARLAEALAHAHSQGVLHRDIKPANILLSPYGRPMLADFNVSLRARNLGTEALGIGGTFAYMAPEHLDACDPEGATLPEQVGERADIYSLGVTLFELLTGKRPFTSPPQSDGPKATTLMVMIQARLRGAPSAREFCPDVPAVLDGVVRRCLEPNPADRYATAAELARALDGCRELRSIDHELPQGGTFTQAVLRRPFLPLVLIGLLPQFVGSVVNITYNWLEIVSKFETAELRQAFNQVAVVYNLTVYPLCVWLLLRQLRSTARTWQKLGEGRRVVPADVTAARRRILTWPAWVVGLSALGWLPGGVIFPLGINLLAEPIQSEVYVHFLISFTLSGLIALTYSYFVVQFVVLRALYPRFWTDPQNVHTAIHAELRERGPRLGLFQLLAGIIPLGGAILLIAVRPDATGQLAFRLLAVALIVLGMAGFGLAIATNKYLARTLEVLVTSTRRG